MTTALLPDMPEMPNAACVGQHALFDEVSHDESALDVDMRHARALVNCQLQCPALADCRSWFAALRPSQKPPGVVAGTIHKRKAQV